MSAEDWHGAQLTGIQQFRGDYFFLSNMYPLKVAIPSVAGVEVETSEHAYQAAKFVNPELQRKIATTATGVESKDLAHELEATGAIVVGDWEISKIGIMQKVVWDKFSLNADLATRLLATKDRKLVEGNTWNDRFWGVCPPESDKGDNNLGLVLMETRAKLLVTES